MIEYEKINLNPQTEKKSCGCKETKKDCSCNNKINIKNNCATPQCFKVDNYFSELIHNWEKEAARYNLGIQELEGIEYVTENNDGELLTKVIFKYRQGHELITREFYCAPAGPEGKPGKDGRDGDTGPQGPKGDKGDTPNLGLVRIHWTDKCDEEKGEFKSRCDNPNLYDLELYLRKPDAITELSNILNTINNTLTQYYVTKESLNEKLDLYAKKDWVLQQILSSISNVINKDPNYTLSYYSPTLKLNKDGKTISTVTIDTSSTSRYVGNIAVYQAGTEDHYQQAINNDNNWISAGWTKSLPVTDSQYPHVWMAVRYINEDGTYQPWTYTRITGTNGKDGDSGQGLQGAVIRIREWKSGTTYYFNEEDRNLADGIRYIDVVLYKGTENIYHYYKCKKTHTSSSTITPNNTTYWTPASEYDFSYINTLIAENAKISYLDTSEIRVFDSTNTLVAGMTSGNASKIVEDDPLSNGKTSDVRIWAGSSKNSNGYTDLTVAPFRVYQNGDLVANKANITGTFNQGNIYVNEGVHLPKAVKGMNIWLAISDDGTHCITLDNDEDTLVVVQNDVVISDATSASFDKNGLYFIVGTSDNKWLVYKFDFAEKKCNVVFGSDTETKSIQKNSITPDNSNFYLNLPDTTLSLTWNDNHSYTAGMEYSLDLSVFNDYVIKNENNDFLEYLNPWFEMGDTWIKNEDYSTVYLNGAKINFENNYAFELDATYKIYDSEDNFVTNLKKTTQSNNTITIEGLTNLKNKLGNSLTLTFTRIYQTVDCSNTPIRHIDPVKVGDGLFYDGALVGTKENETITNLTENTATFKINDQFITLAPNGSGSVTYSTSTDAETAYMDTFNPTPQPINP